MNPPLQVTGGAQVGWANATWPFATLSASAKQVTLSGVLLDRKTFSSDQIVALEPYGVIPVIGRGVRIVHTVESYPDLIVFWCFGSPERLIQRIADLGFQPRATRVAAPRRDDMALRWRFVIPAVLLWNALLLLDLLVWRMSRSDHGPYALLALVLTFMTALGLMVSRRFQAWALKPGRSISEVSDAVMLTMVAAAILLFIFLVGWSARACS